MKRYSAMLLFQFRVSSGGWTNQRRICEQRIIVLHARSAREALKMAKREGKQAALSYENSEGRNVHFELVGVRDLLELGSACGENEVWYDVFELVRPMERQKKLIPAEKDLCAIQEETGSRQQIRGGKKVKSPTKRNPSRRGG